MKAAISAYAQSTPSGERLMRTASWLAPFAVAMIVAAFGLAKSHYQLDVTNDTPSYLYFSPERPPGYAVFLGFVRLFSPSLSALPAIQAILLGVSVGVLANSLRFVAGAVVSLAFLALAASNGTYWENANVVASDALSFALTNVFCALVIFNAKVKRGWLRLGYAIVTALAIAVRPVNLVFLPASILAIALFDDETPLRAIRRNYRSLAALVLVALLAWYSAQIGELIRGQPPMSASPFARGLLAKTLFYQAPAAATQISRSADGRFIEAAIKPVNAYLATTPGDLADYLRVDYYEDPLRFNYIIPTLARAHGFRHAYQLDPQLMAYSIAKMKGAPGKFTGGVLREYWYFVSYKGYHSAAFRRSARGFISHHPLVIPPSVPLLDEELAQQARARADLGLSPSAMNEVADSQFPPIVGKSTLVVAIMRVYHGAAALLGLAAIGLLLAPRSPRRLRPFLAAIAVLAVVLHGEALITAVSEAGMRRYVVPVWTVISAGYCLAIPALLSWISRSWRHPARAQAHQ